MNRERLEEAGINYGDGLKRFVNKTSMYENYLKKFLNDTHYNDMLEAIEKSDVKDAFEMAHALKGVVGTLGMDDFFQKMVPLVNLFRDGQMQGYEELLGSVTEEYEKVTTVIREEDTES